MADSRVVDERVARQLTYFSNVIYKLEHVALELHDAGLHLLSVDFGGSVDGSTLHETWVEKELRRERYGQWQVRRAEDQFEAVGYISDRLSSELSAFGLSRLDLEHLKRSNSISEVIASTSWGAPFQLEHILRSRSSEFNHLAYIERDREAMALGLASTDSLDARTIRSRVKLMFKSFGYKSIASMRPEGMFFRRPSGHLLVWCTLSTLSGWGANIHVRICPALNLSDASDELRAGFEKTHYFVMSEALVKGFGRYRGAGGGGPGCVNLMIYAYTEFLQRTLPLLETAAGEAIDYSHQ